jgi:hypothetical protein
MNAPFETPTRPFVEVYDGNVTLEATPVNASLCINVWNTKKRKCETFMA